MSTLTVRSHNTYVKRGLPWSVMYPGFESEVRIMIDDLSRMSYIRGRDLTRQLLLHLPRFSADELSDPRVIRAEAERLAAKIESKRMGYGFCGDRPRIGTLLKKDVELRECIPQVARIIHERFHYIGSYHEGITHLGLFKNGAEEFPMALASLAPMDIRRLDPLFPSAEDKKKILVISRVFAFDWAPQNTISHLLAQVTRWVKKSMPEVESLLTFLNPNLGFTGASFKAANWNFFLEIEPVSSYIEGNYIPYRDLVSLPEHLRMNVRHCLHDLAPLKLLRYDLGARR
jgi:hypothetical protein